MTYKNAMAELPLGGGKAIILCDQRREKIEVARAAAVKESEAKVA